MQNFKNLKIWKKSIELNKEIYQITKHFPKDELFSLTNQIRRCSISIASNIAEGRGRKTDKDFSKFLYNSLGSLNELECQLFIAKDLNYIQNIQSQEERIEHLRRMILNFIKILN